MSAIWGSKRNNGRDVPLLLLPSTAAGTPLKSCSWRIADPQAHFFLHTWRESRNWRREEIYNTAMSPFGKREQQIPSWLEAGPSFQCPSHGTKESAFYRVRSLVYLATAPSMMTGRGPQAGNLSQFYLKMIGIETCKHCRRSHHWATFRPPSMFSCQDRTTALCAFHA